MGGSTTTTNSSSPPPEFLAAYKSLIDRATGIANQPLQQYSGDIVAGLSPDQQAGITAVQNNQGAAAPFINQASDLYGEAGAPITTNAGGIADSAGKAVTGAAGAAGQSATEAARAGSATALGGAFQGVAAANQAAGTNVWNQLPGVQQGISDWMTPYTQQVVDATQAQFNNQNAQAQQGQLSSAIKQGAFGGDRSGVAQGILAGQQQLAQAPVIANLYNQGYQQSAQNYAQDKGLQANLGQSRANLMAGTALQGGNLLSNSGIAAGQLGANTALGAGSLNSNAAAQAGQLGLQGSQQQLSADTASRSAALNAGQGIAALGTQAQQSGLVDANSLLNVGGIEQNQEQQQLNVPYQQFQQQQAYPFQTQQFLNQAVTGAGANAGGTSSTTQPGPNVGSQILGAGTALGSAWLLSDKRAKEDVRAVGKTKDGQTVYRYRYKGSPTYHMGLIAQEVERKHPGAVAEDASGIKAVDYKAATEDSVRRRASGGGISSDVPDLSVSFIPEIKSPAGIGGGGPPKPPAPVQQDDPMADSIKMVAGMASKKALADKASGGIGDHIMSPDFVASHPATGAIDWDSVKMPDFEIGAFKRGGIVPYRASGGKVMPHIAISRPAPAGIAANLTHNYGNAAADASGRSTLPHTTYYPNVDPWFGQNPANEGLPNPTYHGPTADPNLDLNNILGGSIYNRKRGGGIKGYATRGSVPGGITEDDLPDVEDPEEAAMLDRSRREDIDFGDDPSTQDSTIPEPPAAQGIAEGAGAPFATHPIESEPDGTSLPDPAGGIVDDGEGYQPRRFKDTSAEDKKEALKLSLMAAGFGMMAGKSHNFGANVGAGGAEGVKTYAGLTAQNRAREEKQAEQSDTGNYRQWSLKQQAKHFADTVAMQRKWHEDAGKAAQTRADAAAATAKANAAYRAALLEQGNWAIVTDPLTGKQGMVNKKTGEKKPFDTIAPTGGGSAAAPSPDGGSESPDGAAPAKSPDMPYGLKRPTELPADFPPNVLDEAAAIYSYDQAPPTSIVRTKPYGMALMNAVRQIGKANGQPYDEQFYKISQANRGKFTGGPQGNAIKSFNVAISHLSTLEAMQKALDNKDMKAYNAAKNWLSDQFGGTAISGYEAAHKLVTDEVTKAVIGAAGGVTDREENAKAASSAASKPSARASINAFKGLLGGQLHGLKKQYEFGTRRHDFEEMLEDPAKEVFHDPKYQPGIDPNANQAAELPVIADADGKKTIDRSKIDPKATYNTKQGPKLGRDIIGGP